MWVILCCILWSLGSENPASGSQNRTILWNIWMCQEDFETGRLWGFLQRLCAQLTGHHSLCRHRSRCVWGEWGHSMLQAAGQVVCKVAGQWPAGLFMTGLPTGVFIHLSSTLIVRSQMCWSHNLLFYCIVFPCIFTFVHEESALKCSLEDGPRDGEAQRKISRNLLELLPPGTDKARGAIWIPQLRPLSFNSC